MAYKDRESVATEEGGYDGAEGLVVMAWSHVGVRRSLKWCNSMSRGDVVGRGVGGRPDKTAVRSWLWTIPRAVLSRAGRKEYHQPAW